MRIKKELLHFKSIVDKAKVYSENKAKGLAFGKEWIWDVGLL